MSELIQKSLQLAEELRGSMQHLQTPRHKQEASELADKLQMLTGFKRQLDSGASLEVISGQLNAAGAEYAKLVKSDATIENVKAAVDYTLQDTLEKAEKAASLKAAKATIEAANKEAADAAKTAKKEGGFLQKHFGSRISNGFQRHEEWMKTKTPAARMGFAVGEMVLGSVAMEVGSQMLSQAMSGLKQQQLQQVDSKDGKRTTVLVMAPLTGGERTFKAVVGAGATAAGLVATGLGFYGIFRSHEL